MREERYEICKKKKKYSDSEDMRYVGEAAAVMWLDALQKIREENMSVCCGKACELKCEKKIILYRNEITIFNGLWCGHNTD